MLKKAKEETQLDKIIENLENVIIAADEDDTETYGKLVNNLELLYKLRSGDKPSKTELRDWLPVIGSVGSVLLIVTFEAFGHSLTSKSLGFVAKLKS